MVRSGDVALITAAEPNESVERVWDMGLSDADGEHPVPTSSSLNAE